MFLQCRGIYQATFISLDMSVILILEIWDEVWAYDGLHLIAELQVSFMSTIIFADALDFSPTY